MTTSERIAEIRAQRSYAKKCVTSSPMPTEVAIDDLLDALDTITMERDHAIAQARMFAKVADSEKAHAARIEPDFIAALKERDQLLNALSSIRARAVIAEMQRDEVLAAINTMRAINGLPPQLFLVESEKPNEEEIDHDHRDNGRHYEAQHKAGK